MATTRVREHQDLSLRRRQVPDIPTEERPFVVVVVGGRYGWAAIATFIY